MHELLKKVAQDVRAELEAKYSLPLYGKCIEASERILEKLRAYNIQGRFIQGVVLYDDDSTCSDRAYDEHCWVEIKEGNQVITIDVTADQFQAFIDEKIPAVHVGDPLYFAFEVIPVEYLTA